MAAPTSPCDVKILLANSEPSTHGTYATFPDGRRKAGISPKPDIAGLLSMLVYEFTPSHVPRFATWRGRMKYSLLLTARCSSASPAGRSVSLFQHELHAYMGGHKAQPLIEATGVFSPRA